MPMRPGDWAWITLAAGITAYEIVAARHPRGELLSHAADRYRHHHPTLTTAAIIYIAAHLTRTWPQHLDPLTRVADIIRGHHEP